MRGAAVAQSVKHLTSAQVMILWFVGLSPTSGSLLGSLLSAWSLELALDSVSPVFSAPRLLMRARSLSLSLKNKY